MDREMGYRNMLAVEELASQGKLTVAHKGARSFDFAQYALLSRMAWLTADWPLDKAAKEKHMLPAHLRFRMAQNRHRLGYDTSPVNGRTRGDRQ